MAREVGSFYHFWNRIVESQTFGIPFWGGFSLINICFDLVASNSLFSFSIREEKCPLAGKEHLPFLTCFIDLQFL